MTNIFADIIHQPLSYQVGPLNLTGFGIAILLTFVIAQLISQQEMARRGNDPAVMGDLVFAAVVGGLLGAKIYYAILMHDWRSLTSRAGFVFWGGVIGGIVTTVATMKWKKLSFPKISDVSALTLPAGYAVGRTGCWAVGDDYGRPWTGFLATKFPNGAPPSTVSNMQSIFGISMPGHSPTEVVSVHPTQLYESAAGFVMFMILWRYRDHKHAEGWLFGLWAVLAGIERFLIEFLRAKDDRMIAGGSLTVAQVIAMLFALFGVIYMYMRWNVGPGREGIYAPA